VLNTVKREYAKVQELKGLVAQLTRIERGTHRKKKEVFSML
jgi:hypothetical protein